METKTKQELFFETNFMEFDTNKDNLYQGGWINVTVTVTTERGERIGNANIGAWLYTRYGSLAGSGLAQAKHDLLGHYGYVFDWYRGGERNFERAKDAPVVDYEEEELLGLAVEHVCVDDLEECYLDALRHRLGRIGEDALGNVIAAVAVLDGY